LKRRDELRHRAANVRFTRPSGRVWIETRDEAKQYMLENGFTRPSGRVWIETVGDGQIGLRFG